MQIRIIEEAGHISAVTGMRFSHQVECPLEEIEEVGYANTKTARALSSKDEGHNKFLESIMVWVDIRAPLKWWKQFDTYRIGTTKQSKSTMHSIMKKPFVKSDFTPTVTVSTIAELNEFREHENFTAICDNLPEGYLQTRRVCMSYKTIRHILKQRKHHKLREWRIFHDEMIRQLRLPRLLGGDIVSD